MGYYSYDWGDVHMIVINTERSYVVPGDLEEGGIQYEWIKNDLMNSTAIWNVAISHRPTYSIGEHGNDVNMQYLNEHVFKPYGLDVTFAGHDHNYQHHVDNIHHWVVGSTGLLNDFGYDPFPFTLSAILDYSWAIVDVTPTTFHLKAYNSNGSILEDYTISKNIDGFIQVAVISGSDDAEESEDGLSVNLTSTDLELVYDGQIQKIGMRFQNINIPQGALITRAYVQFTVDEIGSTATALSINGQNSDTALTFATIANNISNRPTTSASVIWTPAAWNTIGESGIDQQSPELKTVIQEIVDRPGWSAGNALALIITGSGSRVADSYDGSPGGAPKLIVEFSENNTTQNQAPTVNAGSDISITLPIDTLSLLGTASDDGLPNNTLTTLWSKVSGPGTVSFQDATSLTTQATFSLPGIYLLQLSADDSSLQASDTVTITVNSEQSATQTVFWEAENMTLSGGYTVADFTGASGGQIIDNSGGSGAAVQTFTGTSGTYDIQVNYLDEDDGQSAFEIYVDDVLKHSWTANIDDNEWHISTVSDVTVNNGSQIKISSVRNLGEHARVDYIKFISDAPVNQAPTVDAGSDLSITLPTATVDLAGSATDDNLPNNTLTTLWSKVSGPGTVTFQSATNLTTQATFSTDGTYVLQLTADDGSLQTTDILTVTVNPEPVAPGWNNTAFAQQSATFSTTFDLTPSTANMNAVLGLSNGSAATWADLACIVRFNTSGNIDARNGGAYQADNSLAYIAGTVYNVRLEVDMAAHSYSIYVTPAGGSEVTIGTDYAFRTEQSSITSLDNRADYAVSGALTVQNFTIDTAAGTPTGVWSNSSFTTQNGIFSAEFAMTPNSANIDSVVGLSNGSASNWSNLACIVRFNTSGTIDARNGDNYQADNSLAYVAGTVYNARFEVNIATHTYSIYVTPAGGSEVTIGIDYAFRTEQNSVTALDNFANYSAAGTQTVENFSLLSAALTTTTGVWSNNSIVAQSGTFSAEFDMTANSANIDSVTGLSNGSAAAWSDLACIVRFNTGGTIDARNGGVYQADNSLSYSTGTVYHVRMVVDIAAHTYSIYVTPDGSGEITIGTDYAFRTEQNSVTVLDNRVAYSNTGTMTIDNFTINP